MGLDLYVGSFTRYYSGNWETILQQAARGGSVPFPVEVSRPVAPPRNIFQRLVDTLRPRQPTAEEAVRGWQVRLRRELGLADVTWNEDPSGEYFTDKPAWDCYGALLLWVAYDELPRAKRRETGEDWDQDSAYLAARINPRSQYPHLIADTEIWVPLDFPEPIRTTVITKDSVVVGSSKRLLRELVQLNAHTWTAGPQQLAQWRSEGAEHGAPLEVSARFAFSIFHELTTQSVERSLPMKLDY